MNGGNNSNGNIPPSATPVDGPSAEPWAPPPLAEDPTLPTDAWWQQSQARWRNNPGFLANLETKAQEHGQEWVRQHITVIWAYWKNYVDLLRVEAYIEEHGSLDDW